MTGPNLASQSLIRVCPNCHGFATAAITTGARHRDGSRVLLRVDCGTCHGTGTVPLHPRLTAADLGVTA